MSPKKVDKEARKKEILQAAMKVMARNGVGSVKINQIASAAGIGKGTVYEYFSSKEEICGAAMMAFLEQIEEVQARKLFRATSALDKFRAIVDSWVEVSETIEFDTMQFLLDIWAEGIRQSNQDLKKVFDMKKVYYEYREILSAIIRDGINAGVFREVAAEETAGIFLASVDGLMIQWLLDRENIDIRKLSKILIETFMNGIALGPVE